MILQIDVLPLVIGLLQVWTSIYHAQYSDATLQRSVGTTTLRIRYRFFLFIHHIYVFDSMHSCQPNWHHGTKQKKEQTNSPDQRIHILEQLALLKSQLQAYMGYARLSTWRLPTAKMGKIKMKMMFETTEHTSVKKHVLFTPTQVWIALVLLICWRVKCHNHLFSYFPPFFLYPIFLNIIGNLQIGNFI